MTTNEETRNGGRGDPEERGRAAPAWRSPAFRTWMTATVCVLTSLFLVSLFKNISHPLFWGDEGMTAMGGSRVLHYGYPKVHDGTNVFYDLDHPDRTLGLDPKTDAYIGGAGWGQYYIAAAGELIARRSNDLYARTGILRVLFALFGLAGLFLWALLGAKLYRSGAAKTAFLAAFAFISLISIPLVLHLREVRYYPVAVLGCAAVAYFYVKRNIFQEMGFVLYAVSLSIALVALYFVFPPAYVGLLLALALTESIFFVADLADGSPPTVKKTARTHIASFLPLAASFAVAYPIMLRFDSFRISSEMSAFFAYTFQRTTFRIYLDNLTVAWSYFASFELLYLALLLKASLFVSYWAMGRNGRRAVLADRTFRVSAFLAVWFLSYIFVIAKIPNFLFSRYLIPLQPVLTVILILDATALYGILSASRSAASAWCRRLLTPVCAAFVLVGVIGNFSYIEGHAYELFHAYEGPLDSVIPFIKEKYPDTSRLVIATNYEEMPFMYYLGAKVIVGYLGYDIEHDASAVPDIVVYRRYWKFFLTVFAGFLTRHPYDTVEFPVLDYPYNNLPELNWTWPVMHQFRTQIAVGDQPKTLLFMRKPDDGR